MFTSKATMDISKNAILRTVNPVKITFKNINQTVEVVSEGEDGYKKGESY